MLRPLRSYFVSAVNRAYCRLCLLFCAVSFFLVSPSFESIAQEHPQEATVAIVNRHPLTSSQLNLDFFLKAGSSLPQQQERQELIQKLIDRELIRQFLERRRIKADTSVLQKQVDLLNAWLEKRGETLDQQLEKLSLQRKQLEEMLALEIAWKMHVTKTLTEKQIRDFWVQHQAEFDGTRVEASQIFRRFPKDATDADRAKIREELTALRERIQLGEITFADAAREYSESPSAANGGNMGIFERHGTLSDELASVAFTSSPGEISAPFETRFGGHLILVERRVPGDLSLEDARPELVRKLSSQLWERQVEQERKAATIRIPTP